MALRAIFPNGLPCLQLLQHGDQEMAAAQRGYKPDQNGKYDLMHLKHTSSSDDFLGTMLGYRRAKRIPS